MGFTMTPISFNIEKDYRSKSEFDDVLDDERLESYLKEKKIKV